MNYRIYPPEELIDVTVELPLSKSMSQRALVLSHLGAAPPAILAHCTDTDTLSTVLQAIKHHSSEAYVADCGSALRFATAVAASTPDTDIVISGTDRLNQRPISALVDALRSLGANINYVEVQGYAPLHIHGVALQGGEVHVDPSQSSQVVSALMMIGPKLPKGLTIILDGPDEVSSSYTRLTGAMIQQAGAQVERQGNTIKIPHGQYTSCNPIKVEPDWSAAVAWYEIEALSMGFVSLPGLNIDSPQPDAAATHIFAPLGVATQPDEDDPTILTLSGSTEQMPRIDASMADTPDMTMSLAVSCAMVGVPFHITGLHTLHHKECNRLEALKEELLKLGVRTDYTTPDTLAWDGRRMPLSQLPVFDCRNDHRMVMALAPTALYLPGIELSHCESVAKSYPDYFEHLQKAGFIIQDASEPPLYQE